MKIGVTGGGGFIGSYVVDELLKRGYETVIFDHHDRKAYNPQAELFLGDVRDQVAMTEFAAHVDGIIHLAAVLGTQETILNPRPAAESNLLGGLNFLEACAQYDIPGTYIAVGNHWMNNPYSITKNMIERFTHMYNKDRGTKVNIVRAVNAYGPKQLAAAPFAHGKVRKIMPAFICRALTGMPIEVYGDGKQISDMVYVADVATALVNAWEYAHKGIVLDKAVEIGPKEHLTVRQVAEAVQHAIDDTVDITYLPMRPGETKGSDVTADTSTLELIGMKPEDLTPFDTGLHATIWYFKESEGKAWQVFQK